MASSTSRSLPTESRAPQNANKSSTPVPADVEPAIPGMLSGEAEDTTKRRKYKYSVARRLLAFIFAWMIHASFIVLPGSLDSLEQSNVPSDVGGVVLRSGQNIPLLMLSCFFCLVGIVGISSVSWKYAHDYDWLFHELYRPMASGGLFGVLSTIVNVYTAHDGTVHPASIVTLVVMSLITVIFSWLALNSYHHL